MLFQSHEQKQKTGDQEQNFYSSNSSYYNPVILKQIFRNLNDRDLSIRNILCKFNFLMDLTIIF